MDKQNVLTCIDPIPNFDPAILPVEEDIETGEINVYNLFTLNSQM